MKPQIAGINGFSLTAHKIISEDTVMKQAKTSKLLSSGSQNHQRNPNSTGKESNSYLMNIMGSPSKFDSPSAILAFQQHPLADKSMPSRQLVFDTYFD